MPTVQFRGKSIECETGASLLDVLKREGLSVYNGKAARYNCRGNATCGTCAVRIDGDVSDPGRLETARLLIPPHHPNYRLRLACQTEVRGDVRVEKYPGVWGTKVGADPFGPIDEADDE
ncbi:MAG: 2Fe-2S iron-sulfur cluster-binding protein [Halobacteriota archaeon]